MGASKQPISHEHSRPNLKNLERQLKCAASYPTYKSYGQVGEFPHARDALRAGVRQDWLEYCKIRAD